VAAHCDGKAERFNCESAYDECGARRPVGKQHKRRNGEKESGGHHQQSGELHRLSSMTGDISSGRMEMSLDS
jgi:hypothetical protein